MKHVVFVIGDIFLWLLLLIGKFMMPIVFIGLMYIQYSLGLEQMQMVGYLLLLMLLGSLLYYIFNKFKARKRLWEAKENHKKWEAIRLFSINNIGQNYKPIEMIEVLEGSKVDARRALQVKAYELGADAVVSIVSTITSDVKGKVNADTFFTPGSGGSINTSNMYYYTGTAVKFI